MELYTVINEEKYDVLANGTIKLKKASYSRRQCVEFLEEAKKYYYTRCIESESTDFNDRYSDSVTYYEQVNLDNIVIKENKFYGVIVVGLGEYDKKYIICTLDDNKYKDFDGSVYSYVDKTYTLKEYNLPEEALDFVFKYYIELDVEVYRQISEGEEFESKNTLKYYLTAFNVIMVDGKAVGVKYKEHEYRLDDLESMVYKYMEVKTYGHKFNYYYTYKMKEWGI